jgi:hypothetical protein
MRASHSFGYAFSIGAAATLLAGCGGLQPPIGAPGAMPQSPAIAAHAERGKSWMLPEAKREDLVYALNFDRSIVYAYEYRRPSRLVGTLAAPADNLCSDNRGHVWLVEGAELFYTSHIVEYAHGGTKPIARLRDPDGYPSDCAVDPVTGDLAVINECENYISSVCDGMGNVDIYKNARGHATKYETPEFYYYYSGGYDAFGNLLVNGTINSGNPTLVELQRGHRSFTNIRVNQPFQRAGGIEWYGPYFAIADGNAGNIYEFSLAHRRLKEVTLTPIDGGFDGSFAVHGTSVVVSGPNEVAWYHYPGGGSPIRSVSVDYAHSVTVSVARAPGVKDEVSSSQSLAP